MLNSRTKQANVASMNYTGQTSMSTKKRAELISQKNGKYSYAQTRARDVQTNNLEKNKAIKEYRNVIDGTLQVLQEVQRTPIEDPKLFKDQI